MFEDKEEKLAINYTDFSPSIITFLLQGQVEKVKGILGRIIKQCTKIEKPYEYRILMKELTSVRAAHAGLRRHHFERVRAARHLPRAAHRADQDFRPQTREPPHKILFRGVRGQPDPHHAREHLPRHVVVLQRAAGRTPPSPSRCETSTRRSATPRSASTRSSKT